MSNRESIQRFLKRALAATAAQGFLRGALRAIPVLVLGHVLLFWIDQGLNLPSWARQIAWTAVTGAAAVLFGAGFFPLNLFSLPAMSSHLHQRARSFNKYGRPNDFRLRSDELVLASQISRQTSVAGVSPELIDRYLDDAAAQLSKASPAWCYPRWNAKRWWIIFILTCGLSGALWAILPVELRPGTRTLFPFSTSEIDQYLRIEPGDASVLLGRDAEIRVTLLTRSINRPALYIRTDDRWVAVEPEQELPGTQVYRVESVVRPLQYRVLWKKDWSRRYTLTPVQPIRIETFSVTIKPPSYVGNQTATQESPEVSGLPGSQVNVKATVSVSLAEAKIIFGDGREKAIQTDGASLTVDFSIDKNDTYTFHLRGKAGEAYDGLDRYPIHAEPDQAPLIHLLSPEQDLIAGEKEKIPLTFDVRDDHGVDEVVLIWERRDRRVTRERVKRFQDGTQSGIFTHVWDLGRTRYQAGEILRYQLEAIDGNVVTGPGRATTPWQIIEIASFERDHEMIEAALEQWRDKAIELLADVNTTKARADKEGADLNAMAGDFNKTAAQSQALEDMLEQIVKKMESDPLADYGLWLEHKAMAQSLEAMNQNLVKNTQAALQTQNKSAVSANLNEMAAELERMSALSEQLSKTQNARDVTEAGENLEQAGEDLAKALEEAAQGGKPNAEAMAQISDILNQAQKALQDIVKSLQQNKDELPEDFINQKALKDLPVGQSQDLMAQIADAIKKGDMKRALDLAKQFLEATRKMSQRLNEANEDYLEQNSASELAKQIGEQARKLDEIADEQRKILSETQKLESKRLQSVLKAQESLLVELARRQRKVVEQTLSTLQSENFDATARLQMSTQLSPMGDVAAEFEQKRVDKSVEKLSTIIGNLSGVQDILRKSTASNGLDNVVKISEEERAILDQLRTPPKVDPNYSSSELEQFNSLQSKQQDLGRRTQTLRRDLQNLSRKTASLGQPVSQSLGAATSDMKQASDELGRKSSQASQKAEESALKNLLDGQSQLQQAQNAMSEMAMQQGGQGEGGGGSGKGPSMKVIQRGSGQSGSQINKVRLPKAEDYKPPKEFREELLESLRETYPKTYEEIIHKYYKRLSE